MRLNNRKLEEIIAQVPASSWKAEFEKTCRRYHLIAAWVAIIFDPVFAITDYFNIPDSWQQLLYVRLAVSVVTIAAIILWRKFRYPSYVIVIVPFFLISLQNAYTYSLIGSKDLLGHNLNYIALLIGAAMFLAWEWFFSVGAIALSAFATFIFLGINREIATNDFLVNGGLLLGAVAVFMFVLIKTRHDLTVKEIKARLALQLSNNEIHEQNLEIQHQNEEIQWQAEKIKAINDNLEDMVNERTIDLEKKNKALEEYAFINAHKLRSPVASILGLANLVSKCELNSEVKEIVSHLQGSTQALDSIVRSITRTIEQADT